MSDDNKVGLAPALNEFDSWVNAMDLMLDEADMDQDDLATFKRQKQRIVRAIQRGKLTFNDDGNAVLQPADGDPLVIQQLTGAALMASDGRKKGHEMAKTFAIMAEMCGVHLKVITGLKGDDSKVTQAIFALLMD